MNLKVVNEDKEVVINCSHRCTSIKSSLSILDMVNLWRSGVCVSQTFQNG